MWWLLFGILPVGGVIGFVVRFALITLAVGGVAVYASQAGLI